MGLRVLIVPDKFKGTATAKDAAHAMAAGWRTTRPEDEASILPMSDGGDGFGGVIGGLLQGDVQSTKTVDAAHRPIMAEWWWSADASTAVIEAARVNGLAQLPHGKFHPFELDTFGLGAVLKEAMQRGVRRCVVGIGGSATNDGGFGVARAMGWEFFSVKSAVIERWTDLHTLSQIKPPHRERWFEQLAVAVDVNNPLLGPSGCTRVYGPQKGLQPADFEFAERCLGALATVAQQEFHVQTAVEPGAGAAGGLGFGLRTFLNATLQPGFELFAQIAGLAKKIEEADLVLTGEGAIDEQTLMGKGVGELAALCRKLNKPCLAIGGVVTVTDRADSLFTSTVSLTSLTDENRARDEALIWIESAAAHAARRLPHPVNA